MYEIKVSLMLIISTQNFILFSSGMAERGFNENDMLYLGSFCEDSVNLKSGDFLYLLK